ncbi:MAG TPA: recombinase RecA, partial [candidate division Zixibacteria bacterium]|nr:recombinase RecA [candidate division Zixibacteria bacterium]
LDLGSTPLKEGATPVIEKSGAWYTYRNDRIGQGREQARQFLRDNPVIAEDIRLKIREQLGLVKADAIREVAKEPEKKEKEKESREPVRARR